MVTIKYFGRIKLYLEFESDRFCCNLQAEGKHKKKMKKKGVSAAVAVVVIVFFLSGGIVKESEYTVNIIACFTMVNLTYV